MARRGPRWALPWLLAGALGAQEAQGAIGFCQDNVTAELVDTGFNAISALNETACKNGNFKWCPLDATIKVWTTNGKNIHWYYYSGCCNGRQGHKLIADPASGLPTCFAGFPAMSCERWHWQQKVENDLGLNGNYDADSEYNYDFQLFPSLQSMDSAKYAGQSFPVPAACVCLPNSTKCIKQTKDGKRCIWCKDVGMGKCHPNTLAVRFGLQFFKLHSVDLKSSLMSFQGWIRSDWYDSRLSYDYQCYGGLAQFAVQAQAGSLENSRIWTPDIELVNNDEPIWGSAIDARLASVYACWNGNPSRGGCGYVWWSRPGVVKALCKYGGLVMFPNDVLECELEFSAWALTGNHQDIVAWKSGVTWSGELEDGSDRNPNEMAGITGGSAYQDYRIKFIKVRRDICLYSCCTDPYPTLVFEISFERSGYYYAMKLFIPSITLTFISFAVFWMDPAVGERLGYGMATILAVLMNDVTAMTMMPTSDSTLLMDYVSLICFIFNVIAMLETCLVLNLYHRSDRSWLRAFMPAGSMRIINDLKRKWHKMMNKWHHTTDKACPSYTLPANRQGLMRMQLYKESFFALDRNHSGELEFNEAHHFAASVLGNSVRESGVDKTLAAYDASGNGRLNFEEFVSFLEGSVKDKNNIELLTKLLRGFIRAADREHAAILEMWMSRAVTVDTLSRVAIPFGFFLALGILFSKSKEDLEAIMGKEHVGKQWMMMSIGVLPLLIIIVLYSAYSIYICPRPGAVEKVDKASMDHVDVPDRSLSDLQRDVENGAGGERAAQEEEEQQQEEGEEN